MLPTSFGYIRFIKSKNKLVLNKSKIDEIVRKIEEGRLTPSFKTDKEHVKHVKHIVSEKKMGNTCPNPEALQGVFRDDNQP